MYKGKDRRQYPRYRAEQLSVSIRPLGSEISPDRVKPVDYNAHGLAFQHPGRDMKPGEYLEMTLALKHVRIYGVVAVIRNIHDGRVGMQFDFSHERMRAANVIDSMEEIERMLHTSHAAVSSGFRKMKKRDRFSDKRQ